LSVGGEERRTRGFCAQAVPNPETRRNPTAFRRSIKVRGHFRLVDRGHLRVRRNRFGRHGHGPRNRSCSIARRGGGQCSEARGSTGKHGKARGSKRKPGLSRGPSCVLATRLRPMPFRTSRTRTLMARSLLLLNPKRQRENPEAAAREPEATAREPEATAREPEAAAGNPKRGCASLRQKSPTFPRNPLFAVGAPPPWVRLAPWRHHGSRSSSR
jgi:hypothetical protein